jgi:hypothetical protein
MEPALRWDIAANRYRQGANWKVRPMRVFLIAVAAAVVLAAGAHFTLNAVQESSADAYATSGARLDQQESVNFYGREG